MVRRFSKIWISAFACSFVITSGCGSLEEPTTITMSTRPEWRLIPRPSNEEPNKAKNLLRSVAWSENILKEIQVGIGSDKKNFSPHSIIKIGDPLDPKTTPLSDVSERALPLIRRGAHIEVHHDEFRNAHGRIEISIKGDRIVLRKGEQSFLTLNTNENTLNDMVKLAVYSIALDMNKVTTGDIAVTIAAGFKVKGVVSFAAQSPIGGYNDSVRILLTRKIEENPIIPEIKEGTPYENILRAFSIYAVLSGFSDSSFNMGYQLIGLGAPLNSTIRLVGSLQGYATRLFFPKPHPAYNGPFSHLQPFDVALNAFNSILNETSEEEKARLASNSVFIEIGDLLRKMRASLPPLK